jgi:hypothetical protein
MIFPVPFGGKGPRVQALAMDILRVVSFCLWLVMTVPCTAQDSTVIRIDASQPAIHGARPGAR